MTLRALFLSAEKAGLLPADDTSRIATALARSPPEERPMPWYLHVLVAIGAWFAAGFFLGFLALFLSGVLASKEARTVLGLLGIGAAVLLRRTGGNIFLHQVALVLSVVAHGLFLTGVAEITHGFDDALVVTLTMLALAAALYFPYPDPLHRFLSCGTALGMTTVWLWARHQTFISTPTLPEVLRSPWWVVASVAGHVALAGHVFIRPEMGRLWRPLGYATVLSLLGLLVARAFPLGFDSGAWVIGLPVKAVVTAGLLAVCAWAAGGEKLRRHGALAAGLGAALLLLCWLSTALVVTAIALLVLGFALQERGLVAIGAIVLPAALSHFYYSLQLDLMSKSLLLMGSGALLMLVYAVLSRLPERRPG